MHSARSGPHGAPLRCRRFRAIKILVTPRGAESASVRWVTNVDLKAGSLKAEGKFYAAEMLYRRVLARLRSAKPADSAFAAAGAGLRLLGELQREQPVHLANEPEAEEGERREEWRVGEGG